MPQVQVSMFNANTQAVSVIINNGAAFTIAQTSAALRFRPQVPAVAPVFVPGPATPGTIGVGPNSIAITPSGWTTPQLFNFQIPETAQITSLQIYIYWNGESGNAGPCQAYFASGGQIFAQTAGYPGAASFDGLPTAC